MNPSPDSWTLLELYKSNEAASRILVTELVTLSEVLQDPRAAATTFVDAQHRYAETLAALQSLRQQRTTLTSNYFRALEGERVRQFLETQSIGGLAAAPDFGYRFDAIVNPAEEALVNESRVHTLETLSSAAVHTFVMRLSSADDARERTLATTELVTVVSGRGTLLLNDDTEEVPLMPGASVLVPPNVTRRWFVDAGLYARGVLRIVVRHVPPLYTTFERREMASVVGGAANGDVRRA
jgi:hypothetical protein